MEETTRRNSIDIRDSCLPGLASDSLDYVHDAIGPPRRTSGLSLLPGVPSPKTVANTNDLSLNTTGLSLNTRPTSPFALSSTDGSLRRCSLRTVTGTGTGEESQSGPELRLKQKNTFSDEKVEIGDDDKKPNEDTSSDELEKRDEETDDNKSMGSDSYTTATSSLSNSIFCKICHCGNEEEEPTLITPCLCSGSLKYVHQECLQRWIKSSDIKRCELCKFPFTMQSKVKPFAEWEKLDMSSLERRKLCCSVTFHAVAITCVIWSLYVLIDRTTEEIQSGELQWPFWTKLVVVAIGFTGGLVFMYIQCKVYLQLCRKWKAYNRTIMVQDMPPDILKQQKKAILDARKPGVEETVLQMDGTSPESRLGSAAHTESGPSGGVADARSNAETQTALRGIYIASALREGTSTESPRSRSSDISVVTISRLLELMEGGNNIGGLSTVPTVIFSTDSELRKQKMTSQSSHLLRTRSALTEPLLICDLPGHSLSLTNRRLSEDPANEEKFLDQEEGERTLDSLDGRVDGPDLSLNVDTTLAKIPRDKTNSDWRTTENRDLDKNVTSTKEIINEEV